MSACAACGQENPVLTGTIVATGGGSLLHAGREAREREWSKLFAVARRRSLEEVERCLATSG